MGNFLVRGAFQTIIINPELLSVLARDAKHVLSFATLRKYQDPSAPSRSLIVSPVSQPVSSTA